MHEVMPYNPQLPPAKSLAALPEYVQKKTSWNGLERLIPKIMEDFHVHPALCIEFGVWHGYSTAALANCFDRVIGADVFYGDVIPGTEGTPMIETTRKSLAPWKNIELRECAMEDFDYSGLPIADLIHIDASHNYKDWFGVMKAIAHCRVAIFHDTGNWFVDVPRLVYEIADRFNLPHFHFPHHEGMDILVCANMLNAQDHVALKHFTTQGFPIDGVVHVGANDGYEIPHYLNLGAKKVIAIEPQKRICGILQQKFGDDERVEIYGVALSCANADMVLNVTQGDGLGSSLMEEVEELPSDCEFEPNEIVSSETVPVRRFDSMAINTDGCNVLVIDAQGAEMDALNGFGEKLLDFELLNIECSRESVYVGGPAAQQVINFLACKGFQQETPIKGHGDIMFRRRKTEYPGWNWDRRMLPLLEPHSYVEPSGPMVLGIVSGRHWKDDSGSWEQCVRSWDANSLFRHPRYYVHGKPMMEAYQEVYKNTRQEIIGLMHDDVEIHENTWDQRVLKQFEDPQVGIVGFFGATAHGDPDMYQKPFSVPQFARRNVLANMRNGEGHCQNFKGDCDVVILDGLSLFVRRKILDAMGGWPQNCAVNYIGYDYMACFEARRQGYKVRLVGTEFTHYGWKSPSLIDYDIEAAHLWLWERYRDVMPAEIEFSRLA